MAENRLERLDNAFLFTVSFFGLLITILQVSIFEEKDVRSLIEISALLFLGNVLPFYIGYIRGSISIAFVNRSIMERMRGWIYLIMGVSGYFGFIFSSSQANLFNNWIVMYSIAAMGLTLVFVLQKWFINVFDVGGEISHQYSCFAAVTSAFLLSFVLRMIVSLYKDLSANPQFTPALTWLLFLFIWLALAAAMTSIVFEKVSRNVVNSRSLNVDHLERRRRRNFILRLFILNFDIFRFASNKNTNLSAFMAWFMAILFAMLGILTFAIPIFSEALLSVSIFMLGLGTYHFCREEIDFSGLGQV